MKKYLIAHDLGTSGNKATLFDTEGRLIKSALCTYETNYFNGNYVEQDPDDWWKAVCEGNRILLDGVDKSEIISVSFSGHMMGCVNISEDGRILRKAIIWADMRSVEQENYIRLNMDEERFYRITGTKTTAAYSLEKLMWVKKHQPQIYKETYKMLLPKDYIVYKLTGKFMTDYSDASCTNAFDINTHEWSSEILEIAGISLDKMPEVHESTHVAGEVTAEAAVESGLAEGTLVVLGAGDGACAPVGAMALEENNCYASMGSSAWISIVRSEPIFDEQMRTFNYMHLIPGLYLPCGTMQAAGNSWSFMKRILGDGLEIQAKEDGCSTYSLMDDLVASSPVGSNGLIYLPYLLGERSPRWNPYAKGTFIGLKMEHKKADLLRATIEGIMMNLDIVFKIFSAHADIEYMNVIGGLVKGRPVWEILTDGWGVQTRKLTYLDEATSMGAAMAAGVGAGVLKWDDIEKFVQVQETLDPDVDKHAQYEPYKHIFNDSYYALVDIYDKLAQIQK